MSSTWKTFRSQFWGAVGVLLAISTVFFSVDSLVHWIHRDDVAATASVIKSSNAFYSELAGTRPAPGGQIGRFVKDLRPYIISAQRKYQPGLTHGLPSSITNISIPNRKYQDVAFYTRVPIFGTNGDLNAVDPTTYKEGGHFSSDSFLPGLTAIVSQTGVDAYTNAAVPKVGHRYAAFPVWVYPLWFFALTMIAYLVGITDFDSEEIGGLKVSLAQAQAPLPERLFVSVLCAPIGVFSWARMGLATLHYKREERSLIRRLETPGIPLSDEAKVARDLLKRAAKLKMGHLPEVQSAIQFATETLKSISNAATHQAENDARLAAVAMMEEAAPLARKAHEFHHDLHQAAQAEIETRMATVVNQMKALEAGSTTNAPKED